MILETLAPRWRGRTVVVAAPGPSLSEAVAERCKGIPTIAVQDAWRRMPWCGTLYGCEQGWWDHHEGAAGFNGAKWSTHDDAANDKRWVQSQYGVRLVAGKQADGFSLDPAVIHYGASSGFQAVNMAILMGAARIVLVGFDMRTVDGKPHFFGHHGGKLRNPGTFATFIRAFDKAAERMPDGLTILNATPGSALKCFPMVGLDDALALEAA